MYAFQEGVERKIREAQERGDFDNLEGSHEPVIIEDDSHVPEDLRLAYKILKNADCLPPEIELRKEIRRVEDLLESIPDEQERYRHMKRLNLMITKLNMMGKGSPLLEDTEYYYYKVLEKTGKKYKDGDKKR